jgi:acyl-CoA hydrolase
MGLERKIDLTLQQFTTYRLVKSEDLNHHGTLYAGRTAEWFVEAGFIAASSLSDPARTVCLQIHGMTFSHPVRRGDIARFQSQVAYTGRSKLVSYVKMCVNDQMIVEGFITFIHVDEEGQASAHGLRIHPESPEERDLQERAKALFER